MGNGSGKENGISGWRQVGASESRDTQPSAWCFQRTAVNQSLFQVTDVVCVMGSKFILLAAQQANKVRDGNQQRREWTIIPRSILPGLAFRLL